MDLIKAFIKKQQQQMARQLYSAVAIDIFNFLLARDKKST